MLAPTQATVETTARTIAGRFGLRAKPSRSWSFTPSSNTIEYVPWDASFTYPYPYWIALLLHEVAHVKFTVHRDYPDTHKHTFWPLLRNVMEDRYIEREFATSYPQGMRYMQYLQEIYLDLMEHGEGIFSHLSTAKQKDTPAWLFYLMAMLAKFGGDTHLVSRILKSSPRVVRQSWKETLSVVDKQRVDDFMSSDEVFEDVLKAHWEPCRKMLTEENDTMKVPQELESLGRLLDAMRHHGSGHTTGNEELSGSQMGVEGAIAHGEKVGIVHRSPGGRHRAVKTDEMDEVTDGERYDVLKRHLAPVIRHLVNRLTPVLRENASVRYIRRNRTGRLDEKRLYRVALGDAKVFVKQEEQTGRKYAFVLAVDESGSMEGDQFSAARATSVVFAEALQRLHIPWQIARFDDEFHWCTDGWTTSPSSQAKENIALNARNGGTNDATALKEIVKRATTADGTPVIIFITDGCGDSEMREISKKIEDQKGIPVYGVLFGDESEVNTDQYAHVLHPKTPWEVPMMVAEIIRKTLR